MFTWVKYFEIWHNFGLRGAPVPKRSNVPNITNSGSIDEGCCPHKKLGPHLRATGETMLYPLKFVSENVLISQVAQLPRVKSISEIRCLKPRLTHFTYPCPNVYRGKNCKKKLLNDQ